MGWGDKKKEDGLMTPNKVYVKRASDGRWGICKRVKMSNGEDAARFLVVDDSVSAPNAWILTRDAIDPVTGKKQSWQNLCLTHDLDVIKRKLTTLDWDNGSMMTYTPGEVMKWGRDGPPLRKYPVKDDAIDDFFKELEDFSKEAG